MEPSDFRNYHRREAARLRLSLATATTAGLQARLWEQAEEHERLAQLDSIAPELEEVS
jgi:hypothetical protein